MKRDLDLVRELLLRLESLPVTSQGIVAVKPNGASIGIESYTPQQISYHLSLLKEAGFLDCTENTMSDGTIAFRGLTWAGHDFLDSVRDPKTWARTKEGALAAGGFTLDILKDLAKGLIKKQIEEHTGVKL